VTPAAAANATAWKPDRTATQEPQKPGELKKRN
jgi:hypothetical protein